VCQLLLILKQYVEVRQKNFRGPVFETQCCDDGVSVCRYYKTCMHLAASRFLPTDIRCHYQDEMLRLTDNDLGKYS